MDMQSSTPACPIETAAQGGDGGAAGPLKGDDPPAGDLPCACAQDGDDLSAEHKVESVSRVIRGEPFFCNEPEEKQGVVDLCATGVSLKGVPSAIGVESLSPAGFIAVVVSKKSPFIRRFLSLGTALCVVRPTLSGAGPMGVRGAAAVFADGVLLLLLVLVLLPLPPFEASSTISFRGINGTLCTL